jgi:hypothetical protein
MLEETRNCAKVGVKGRTGNNSKYVPQPKAYIHTGARHEQWYGESKHCCMCGGHEDWRHMLTCKSLDAELIRADSWSKLRKMMNNWNLSADVWTSMENGIRYYIQNPLKRGPANMPAEPPSPFGTTFYTQINRLKVAFRAQSQVGMSRDWIFCIDHHFQENGSNLTGQECITKLTMGRWDHTDRIWTYHNNRYHENTSQQVSQYKIEALNRRYEEIWGKHAGLVERLHDFQTTKIKNRQSIGNLNYESKHLWANLADQYIVEASAPIQKEMFTLSKLLGARLGVG